MTRADESPERRTVDDVVDFLLRELQEYADQAGEPMVATADTPLGEVGIDSLLLSEVFFSLEEWSGHELPDEMLERLDEMSTLRQAATLLIESVVSWS